MISMLRSQSFFLLPGVSCFVRGRTIRDLSKYPPVMPCRASEVANRTGASAALAGAMAKGFAKMTMSLKTNGKLRIWVDIFGLFSVPCDDNYFVAVGKELKGSGLAD